MKIVAKIDIRPKGSSVADFPQFWELKRLRRFIEEGGYKGIDFDRHLDDHIALLEKNGRYFVAFTTAWIDDRNPDFMKLIVYSLTPREAEDARLNFPSFVDRRLMDKWWFK